MPIYFISGHTKITQDEFDAHYKKKILELLKDDNNKFVVGESIGVDRMAQDLITDYINNVRHEIFTNQLTIYHVGRFPRYTADGHIKTIGGFKSHSEKDAAMTRISDYDIAYVRSIEESKKLYGDSFNPKIKSGTQKNIERRKNIKV